jgi:hypothetical protein
LKIRLRHSGERPRRRPGARGLAARLNRHSALPSPGKERSRRGRRRRSAVVTAGQED